MEKSAGGNTTPGHHRPQTGQLTDNRTAADNADKITGLHQSVSPASVMEDQLRDGLNGNLRLERTFLANLGKSDSGSCESESESEPYHDCCNCDNSEDEEEEDDIDGGVDCEEPDNRDSLEFEYEPGISLASMQLYQTCDCQQDSESGEHNSCREI